MDRDRSIILAGFLIVGAAVSFILTHYISVSAGLVGFIIYAVLAVIWIGMREASKRGY